MTEIQDTRMSNVMLAVVESVGLGGLGLDHLVMIGEAKAQGLEKVEMQHRQFAMMKPALLLGSIVIFMVLRRMIKAPIRDPIFIFPMLLFMCWLLWTVHDYLWVIMGTFLDYEYVFNVYAGKASNKGLAKLVVILSIFLLTILAWHFLWFFSGQE